MNRYQLLLRNLVMAQMLLHNTDPNVGGGGGGGQDPAAAFQNALKKKNDDALALASQLFDENFSYRTQIRELKTKVPKEGDIVLTGDEAKEYQSFKALNVKADDAKKAIDSVSTLEKQNKELAGMEALRELADIGLDGSKLKLSVLKDQIQTKFPDAVISFKDEKDKDGKAVRTAYIKKSEKDSEQNFTDFANAELADYLPSLKVSNEAPTQTFTGNTPDPKATGGHVSVFDKIRDEAKAKTEAGKPVPGMDIDSRFGRPATAA